MPARKSVSTFALTALAGAVNELLTLVGVVAPLCTWIHGPSTCPRKPELSPVGVEYQSTSTLTSAVSGPASTVVANPNRQFSPPETTCCGR